MRDKRLNLSKATQVVALSLACGGIVWGLFAAYSVAFPGPSGEWAVVGVYAAYVVDVPLGLVAFLAAFLVKKGSARLRRIAIATSLVAMCFPLTVHLIWWMRQNWWMIRSKLQ